MIERMILKGNPCSVQYLDSKRNPVDKGKATLIQVMWDNGDSALLAKEVTAKKAEFHEILKANPYHDELGRFSTKDAAVFVSTGPAFTKTLAAKRKALLDAEKEAPESFTLVAQDEDSLRAYDEVMSKASQSEWDSLSKAQQLAINDYTGWESTGMNKLVSGVETHMGPTANKEAADTCALIDAAMNSSHLPESVKLYRAMNVSRMAGADFDLGRGSSQDDLKKLVGTVFVDPGYGSSSTSIRTAHSFGDSKRPIFEINAPKGTNGVWVGSDHIAYDDTRSSEPKRSATDGEHEFVLSRKMAYVVTGVAQREVSGRKFNVVSVDIINPKHQVDPSDYLQTTKS